MHEEFDRLHKRLDHFHTHLLSIEEKLDTVLSREATINRMEYRIMTKLDDLEAKLDANIAQQKTTLDNILAALQKAIDASGADAAHFDAVIKKIEDSTAALDAADDPYQPPAPPAP